MVKNYALNLNYRHQFKMVLFDIILQTILLDRTFRMVYVKYVSYNKWEVGEYCILVEIHKNTFHGLQLSKSSTKSTFLLGNVLVAVEAYANIMSPPLIVDVGGGGGWMACWLIT